MKKLIPFVLISFLCLICCKDPKKEALSAYISQNIGKQVTFPDSLEYRSIYDSIVPLPEKDIKIVIFINGECYACLNQFIDWQDIGDSLIEEGNVDLLFYIRTLDFNSIKQILSDIEFKYPFYIDPKGDILYLNDIPHDQKIVQTFLVDQDNKIVLIGSPVNNPKMLELYIGQIRKLSVEKG
jgi:hypothetical protein